MSVMQEESRLNGVDTATLFATIGAVRARPELAKFTFRTESDWVSGTHSEGRFPGFYGAGQEHTHATETVESRPPTSVAFPVGYGSPRCVADNASRAPSPFDPPSVGRIARWRSRPSELVAQLVTSSYRRGQGDTRVAYGPNHR